MTITDLESITHLDFNPAEWVPCQLSTCLAAPDTANQAVCVAVFNLPCCVDRHHCCETHREQLIGYALRHIGLGCAVHDAVACAHTVLSFEPL